MAVARLVNQFERGFIPVSNIHFGKKKGKLSLF